MWVQPQLPLSQAVPSVGCPGSAEQRICQCWSWAGRLPPLLPSSPGAAQGQPRCPFLPPDKQPLFQAPEQNPAPSQLLPAAGRTNSPCLLPQPGDSERSPAGTATAGARPALIHMQKCTFPSLPPSPSLVGFSFSNVVVLIPFSSRSELTLC